MVVRIGGGRVCQEKKTRRADRSGESKTGAEKCPNLSKIGAVVGGFFEDRKGWREGDNLPDFLAGLFPAVGERIVNLKRKGFVFVSELIY